MFYVVRALSPYTEYEFYVIAVNNIGRGPPSIPATTTTGETGKRLTARIVMSSALQYSLIGLFEFTFSRFNFHCFHSFTKQQHKEMQTKIHQKSVRIIFHFDAKPNRQISFLHTAK